MRHRYNLCHERTSYVQYVLHCGAIGGRGQSSFNTSILSQKNGIVELVNKSFNGYDTKKSLN